MPSVRSSNLKYYNTVHQWIHRSFGSANRCINSGCDKSCTSYEWANISKKYFKDISDWKMLCAKCHRKFDSKPNCKKGHPLSGKNLYLRKDRYGRGCKICRQKSTREWYRSQVA